MTLDPTRRLVEFPAGYYFDATNVATTQLIEEADAPSEEGWERVRTAAFEALQAWQADNPRLDPATGREVQA